MRLVQAKTSGLTTIRAENAVSPVKVLRTNNTSGPIMRLVGKNRAADCIMTEVSMRSAARAYTNIKNGLPARILFELFAKVHIALRNRHEFVFAFHREVNTSVI